MCQIAVREVQFQPFHACRKRMFRRGDKIILHSRDVRLRNGVRYLERLPPKATALGAIVGQPPCSSAKCASPSHGRDAEALRPACAIWIPGTAPCPLMNRLMRVIGSMCLSAQMPASPGEILPSGETAVASAMTNPAPPTAREPRCTRCQSVATPSSDEYWHMGDTPIRLRSVTDLIVSG